MPLQHVTNLVQLAHVVVGEGGHPDAPPRDVLDQPLLGEQPQGLTQRRPADPEPPGQLLLDQALPGIGTRR